MQISLTLVDVNVRLVAAWRDAFADAPEVRVAHGSILQQPTDAWVTPTNARGSMDGGLDAVMKRYFGAAVEQRVRREITQHFRGHLPVGAATCVSTAGLWTPPTGPRPLYLISAPTMSGSSEDVSRTLNVAWAFAAALQAAHQQNMVTCGAGDTGEYGPGEAGVYSLAVPGLGSRTGQVPPAECARQMRLAYDLFRGHDFGFDSFDAMRDALTTHLGDPAPRRMVPVRPPRANGRRRGLFRFFGGHDEPAARTA